MGDEMKNGTIAVCVLAVLLISTIGCTTEGEDKETKGISITVTNVERRMYNDLGTEADEGKIYLYVFFTIKNERSDPLSVSAIWFELESPEGAGYNSNWLIWGGDSASELERGASGDYYVGFEIDDDDVVTTEWQLQYDAIFVGSWAYLANIKEGINDPIFATLTIDSYHNSDVDDQNESAEAGNAFLYVNITLENSADNDESLSTNPFDFDLYADSSVWSYDGYDDAKPATIDIGGEGSWYIYFEIPEDATLEKLVYAPIGIPPAEALFA